MSLLEKIPDTAGGVVVDDSRALTAEGPTAAGAAEHVDSIDCLRGIAALGVCCAHTFVQGFLVPVAHYGWLGVYVFFVVSGFVIPYSLRRARYTVGAYPRFLAKRLVRLDPPYLFSIAAAISLHYISYWSPHFQGEAPHYTAKTILLHLGYLNSFFGGIGAWIIPVYWTLGIEFQYYLLVGILYPLLASRRAIAQFATFALFLAASGLHFPLLVASERTTAFLLGDVDQGPLIGHYAMAFLLGILAFRFRTALSSAGRFVSLAIVAGMLLATVCGPVIAVTAFCTALVIAFVPLKIRFLAWLGSISYSLYLFHLLVVNRVLHAGGRVGHSELLLFCLQIGAIAAAILVACLAARYIEEPAKRVASRIRLIARPPISAAITKAER